MLIPFIGNEFFFSTWQKAAGLSEILGAFIQATGKVIPQLGFPLDFATAYISLVVAFAMTSVDTGARLSPLVFLLLSR